MEYYFSAKHPDMYLTRIVGGSYSHAVSIRDKLNNVGCIVGKIIPIDETFDRSTEEEELALKYIDLIMDYSLPITYSQMNILEEANFNIFNKQ